MSSKINIFRTTEPERPQSALSSSKPTILVIKPPENTERESAKTKPQFIVKKVQNEEVFEDPMRGSNMIGLSQINEENTGDLEEVMLPRTSLDLNDPHRDTKNVFKAEMVSSTKYREFQKGPQFQNGQVVRHSIVGSVDLFERHQRHTKKNSKDTGGYGDRGSLSDISVVNNLKHPGSMAFDVPSSNFSDRLGSQGSNQVRKFGVISERKKTKNTDIKLTKEDVITELDKFKERQSISAKDDPKAYKDKNLHDKLYLTKEERNLKKFATTADHWQKTMETLNHKVKRDAGVPMMLSGEDHREKKEQAETLDIIKPDEERYGHRLWEKTLRKYEDKDAKLVTALASQTPQERIQTADTDRPASAFEVIRKPRLIQTPTEAQRYHERVPTRTEREYLESKLSSRQHILEGIRPPEVEGMNDLVVQGKNKLELESEALLKQANTKEAVRVPKNYFENKGAAKQQEEIILAKRSNMEVTRHGLSAFIK